MIFAFVAHCNVIRGSPKAPKVVHSGMVLTHGAAVVVVVVVVVVGTVGHVPQSTGQFAIIFAFVAHCIVISGSPNASKMVHSGVRLTHGAAVVTTGAAVVVVVVVVGTVGNNNRGGGSSGNTGNRGSSGGCSGAVGNGTVMQACLFVRRLRGSLLQKLWKIILYSVGPQLGSATERERN